MALTDEQVAALRDLGQMGAKILTLKATLERVNVEITRKVAERSRLLTDLQDSKQEFQDTWETLRQ